jgi:hypothetical protein
VEVVFVNTLVPVSYVPDIVPKEFVVSRVFAARCTGVASSTV